MVATRISTVFFDLGNTLGVAEVSPPPRHLIGFQVFPSSREVLDKLKARGLRLGIISDTGDDAGAVVDAVLSTAGILDFFDPSLRIYSKDVGMRKDSKDIFELSAMRAGVPPEQCLFVGESSEERKFAGPVLVNGIVVGAGMEVAPDAQSAEEVIDGQGLRFVRVAPTGPGEGNGHTVLRSMRHQFTPMHLSGANGGSAYGIASERAICKLMNMRFMVELLGELDAPKTSEMYILKDDSASESGFGVDEGEVGVFFSTPSTAKMVVGTDADGVLVVLPAGVSPDEFHFRHTQHGHTLKLQPDPSLLHSDPPSLTSFLAIPPFSAVLPAPTSDEVAEFGKINSDAILSRVKRYSGVDPVSAGQLPIVSRHIAHPDNARAVDAAAIELQAVGGGRLVVRLKPFTHLGIPLHNVEAELLGDSDELVLVTAHLDSTAMASPPFNPETDAAPGADDDASGLAAVIAIAERFSELAAVTKPARTVRFVLFNAEEHGLVGSWAYAREQRSIGRDINAVFQMDMIGYNVKSPRAWEIHAGFRKSRPVEQKSLELAEVMRRLAPAVSPNLPEPQIYHSDLPAGDPADGRSDHTPFQAHKYAACTTSEDLFAGPTPFPTEEGNPDYHRKSDTFIDAEYAADIARAVAAAAWAVAKAAPTPPGSTGFASNRPTTLVGLKALIASSDAQTPLYLPDPLEVRIPVAKNATCFVRFDAGNQPITANVATVRVNGKVAAALHYQGEAGSKAINLNLESRLRLGDNVLELSSLVCESLGQKLSIQIVSNEVVIIDAAYSAADQSANLIDQRWTLACAKD